MGKLKSKDFKKGIILAVVTAVLTYIESVTNTGSFDINVKLIASVSFTAAIAYLIKNLGTNDEETQTFGIPHN